MAQFAHSRLIMAVAGDLESKLSTVEYVEADMLEFHFRIAAQVQRNCVNKPWKVFSLVSSMRVLL